MLPSLAALNSLTQLPTFKANIYIRGFRACIAGFSVSAIAKVGPWAGTSAASTTSLPSFTSGGSLRWMSPELLDPSRLEDRDPRPTKESDCFTLGMVIYEVRVSKTAHLSLAIVHRACRCYADMCRTMVGIRRESTMPYCKGFGRTSQTRRHISGLWTNCGRSSCVVGMKNARRDRTCRPSVHA